MTKQTPSSKQKQTEQEIKQQIKSSTKAILGLMKQRTQANARILEKLAKEFAEQKDEPEKPFKKI